MLGAFGLLFGFGVCSMWLGIGLLLGLFLGRVAFGCFANLCLDHCLVCVVDVLGCCLAWLGALSGEVWVDIGVVVVVVLLLGLRWVAVVVALGLRIVLILVLLIGLLLVLMYGLCWGLCFVSCFGLLFALFLGVWFWLRVAMASVLLFGAPFVLHLW